LQNVIFHGFMYLNGALTTSVSQAIHGSVQMSSAGSYSGSTLQIFFDPSVLPPHTTNGGGAGTGVFQQTTWKEVAPVKF
jgi:hypothetical protein